MNKHKNGNPYRGYGGRWTRAFDLIRPQCINESISYQKLYGDLVAFVDHYYYGTHSATMQWLLGDDSKLKEIKKEK